MQNCSDIYNCGSTPIPDAIKLEVGPTNTPRVTTGVKPTSSYGLSDSAAEIGPVNQKMEGGLKDYRTYGMTTSSTKVDGPNASTPGPDSHTSR